MAVVAAAYLTRKNNNAAFEDQQRGVLFDGEQRGLENERCNRPRADDSLDLTDRLRVFFAHLGSDLTAPSSTDHKATMRAHQSANGKRLCAAVACCWASAKTSIAILKSEITRARPTSRGTIGARIGSVVISLALLFGVLRYRVEKKRRSISPSTSSVNLLFFR